MGNFSIDNGFIANTNLGNVNRIYKGSERRRYHRRTGHDRRSMLRFEPETEDRRSYRDRRSGNIWDGRERNL